MESHKATQREFEKAVGEQVETVPGGGAWVDKKPDG